MKKKKDSPPIHKYQVVDYSVLRKPTIDRFCKTLKEAKEFVLKNNGKFIGKFKTEYKIEETGSYKKWKERSGKK